MKNHSPIAPTTMLTAMDRLAVLNKPDYGLMGDAAVLSVPFRAAGYLRTATTTEDEAASDVVLMHHRDRPNDYIAFLAISCSAESGSYATEPAEHRVGLIATDAAACWAGGVGGTYAQVLAWARDKGGPVARDVLAAQTADACAVSPVSHARAALRARKAARGAYGAIVGTFVGSVASCVDVWDNEPVVTVKAIEDATRTYLDAWLAGHPDTYFDASHESVEADMGVVFDDYLRTAWGDFYTSTLYGPLDVDGITPR